MVKQEQFIKKKKKKRKYLIGWGHRAKWVWGEREQGRESRTQPRAEPSGGLGEGAG